MTGILHPHPSAHHSGQAYFASSDSFLAAFDFKESAIKVRIEVSRAHF
jgi:SulP family sulfate permease